MTRFVSLLALLIGALAVLVLAFSCEPDPYKGQHEGGDCKTDETRCVDEYFQLCSSEHRWENLEDCAEFGLVCCLDDVCCDAPDGGE